MSRRLALALSILAALSLLGAGARAQPWGKYLGTNSATANGWIEVPDHPELNPAALTIEAWVYLDTDGCRSLVGKNYLVGYWLGVCEDGGEMLLRSWINGVSLTDGVVRRNTWEHVAVIYDGTHRHHLINGEVVGSLGHSGPVAASSAPLRLLSDVPWPYTPKGFIEDVRIWNRARGDEEIRRDLNDVVSPAASGLVANWRFDGSAEDATGRHDGTLTGTGVGYWYYLGGPGCGSGTAELLCLFGRFGITADWRDLSGHYARALRTGPATPGSGLMYFVAPDNWEMLLKMVDACVFPWDRYWLFVSGSTELFYRLDVRDYATGARRIYFSYGGPNPPAITDTDAFATCP